MTHEAPSGQLFVLPHSSLQYPSTHERLVAVKASGIQNSVMHTSSATQAPPTGAILLGEFAGKALCIQDNRGQQKLC